ncbi:MAG: SLATT domain-containing protein [Anaerolineales bacterium]|nr:SLATT domain-containing protein [Anaerolineales bacterium]
MSELEQSKPTVLGQAWKRYAELDYNSQKERDAHFRIRRWIYVLSILATTFAILVDNFSNFFYFLGEGLARDIGELIVKILLILTPITSSIIAAFYNKFRSGQRYLVFRAAAEEVLKEIYIYRTVLKHSSRRDKWLNERLAHILRKLYRSADGELTMEPYDGKIPPYYDPVTGWGDSGFDDLDSEQYIDYRLLDQLTWHIKKIEATQKERKRNQILILAFGGSGAFLAALGGGFSIWVALTASITAALVGWEELRGMDTRVQNYSRVVLELSLLRDRWLTLTEAERTEEEFFKMVREAEKVLWDQNVEFTSAMIKALAEAIGDESDLIDQMIKLSRDYAHESMETMQDKIVARAEGALDESVERVAIGMEDSMNTVGSLMTSIADQVQSGFEDDGFQDEVFEDEVTPPAGAVAQPVGEAFQDEVFVDDEPFVDEVFVDEVFQDEVDLFGPAVAADDDDWKDVGGVG